MNHHRGPFELRRHRKIAIRLMIVGVLLAMWCCGAGIDIAMGYPTRAGTSMHTEIQSILNVYTLVIVFTLLGEAAGLTFCIKWSLSLRRMTCIGICQTCGYNLTANLSGICPECGKPCKPDATAT